MFNAPLASITQQHFTVNAPDVTADSLLMPPKNAWLLEQFVEIL
jgi:hypothetical protein